MTKQQAPTATNSETAKTIAEELDAKALISALSKQQMIDIIAKHLAKPSATVDEKVKVEEPKGLHSCPDGKVWADYYCAINPSADNGTMIGWFCNAMMAMHDHLYQTGEIRSQQSTVDVDALWEKYREYDGNIYYFVTEENFKKAISELSQKRYTVEEMRSAYAGGWNDCEYWDMDNTGDRPTFEKFISQFDSEGNK
jgi:hypothetical protein